MGKGAQGKKITYQTKRQKEYLQSYEKMDKVSFLQKAVSESLEKLSLPESSWTLPELKATGRKFTYEFAGKTEEKTPYNNFLTGYNTLHSLISLYRFLAELAWCMESNTNKCKEYLYLAAYCQKCICQWPDHDENHNSIGLVSLSRLDLFYMALIADANTEFIKKLGELLSIPERTWNPFLIYRGNAVIRLSMGDKERAVYYAEKMLKEDSHPVWLNYAHCIEAIVSGDADTVNGTLCAIVNSWRRTSGPPRLLIIHAIGLAKLAVKNGLQVTIDTMDCPQALIQPAQMDYSRLELPRPKYGFPWEKEAKE
nr:hypothetical protein [uncultured Oscillibacter sp.]